MGETRKRIIQILAQSLEKYPFLVKVNGDFWSGLCCTGLDGNGSECAGGVNWYVKGKQDWRFTMDVSQVEDSPAQQDRTGFIAGGSGLLVRAQVWTYF